MTGLPILNSVQPLALKPVVILRGEYALTIGSNGLSLASPNAKNGTLLILSDQTQLVTLMAHLDNNQDFELSFLTIMHDLTDHAEIDFINLKCDLMGTESHDNFEQFLKEKGLKQISKETWTGSHPYNVTVASDGIINTNNDPNKTRELLTDILFTPQGEARVSEAMSGKVINSLSRIETPSLSNKPTLILQSPAVKIEAVKAKTKIENSLDHIHHLLWSDNFLRKISVKDSLKKLRNKFRK